MDPYTSRAPRAAGAEHQVIPYKGKVNPRRLLHVPDDEVAQVVAAAIDRAIGETRYRERPQQVSRARATGRGLQERLR